MSRNKRIYVKEINFCTIHKDHKVTSLKKCKIEDFYNIYGIYYIKLNLS